MKKLVRQREHQRESERLQNSVVTFDAETTLCTNGIYYLTFEGEIVYVGATNSLVTRMSQHLKEAVKQFDAYSFKPYPAISRKELLNIEKAEIRKHSPKYNVVHNLKTEKVCLD